MKTCVLCRAALDDGTTLKAHLEQCAMHTRSCPHCRRGIQASAMAAHLRECRQNLRECFRCGAAVENAHFIAHATACCGAPPVRMLHGTSPAAAALIVASGRFHPSNAGVLGEGVYMSADASKAVRYGSAIIECAVFPGRTAVVNQRYHRLQKCWRREGYDSAWIPPNAFVSSSRPAAAALDAAEAACTRGRTGGDLEEHCIADPRRVIPMALL